jgi:hypothetical protein
VRADGTVESVTITKAHPFFRDYVEVALKQWEFESNGKSFKQGVTVRFSLLDGRCDDIRSLNPGPYRETRVNAHLPESVEISTCTEPVVVNEN